MGATSAAHSRPQTADPFPPSRPRPMCALLPASNARRPSPAARHPPPTARCPPPAARWPCSCVPRPLLCHAACCPALKLAQRPRRCPSLHTVPPPPFVSAPPQHPTTPFRHVFTTVRPPPLVSAPPPSTPLNHVLTTARPLSCHSRRTSRSCTAAAHCPWRLCDVSVMESGGCGHVVVDIVAVVWRHDERSDTLRWLNGPPACGVVIVGT